MRDILDNKKSERNKFDNLTILEKGDRNGQLIALIEKESKSGIEYVVAFNYEIEDDNLTWGYGYYYTDYSKAAHDFKIVIEGGNLADTFEEKKIPSKELKIELVGVDNFDRPVYRDKDGKLYKDINLGDGTLALCTSSGNNFFGEPDESISDDVKIAIVKTFLENKDYER